MSPTLALLIALAAPAPAVADAPAPPAAEIAPVRGTLRRRGVRAPAIGVEIIADTPAGPISGFTDADGRFQLPLPPGPTTLRVDDRAFEPLTRAITVPPGGLDLPPWGLTPRPDADDAAVRVYGRRPLASVSLDAEALRTTAGTLGDPLRAVQALPSVGHIVSIVPFPVVRGSAPGDTAILVDGTPIPLLFHSGVGQGVIPGPLVERITLHPGLPPIDIGRSTGGAIEVTTAEPDAPGLRGEALVDLVQSGALASAPLGDHHRLTAAARVGYPGWILSLLEQPVIIEFADYHLRYGYRDGRRRARISLFGATDTFGDPRDGAETITEMAFHRLALRWSEPLGDATLDAALDLGLDRMRLPGHDTTDAYFFRRGVGADIHELLARAAVELAAPLTDAIELRAGVEGLWRRTDNDALVHPADDLLVAGTRVRPAAAGWLALRLDLGPLRLTPGLRVDIYGDPVRVGVDPRLDARLALGSDVAIIGRLGLTHAPQRYSYPIPGIGEYAGSERLQRALQAQLGIEIRADHDLEIRAAAFAQRLDGLRDSELHGLAIGNAPLDTPVDGRVTGAELLVRRREGPVHGWLSYTLQRSERRPTRVVSPAVVELETGWRPSFLDRPHLLNLALTLDLPARWRLGARIHHAAGRPVGYFSTRRLDPYTRLDLRISKDWITDLFELSAWIDVINATHAVERERKTIDNPTGETNYTLPMMGVRARF